MYNIWIFFFYKSISHEDNTSDKKDNSQIIETNQVGDASIDPENIDEQEEECYYLKQLTEVSQDIYEYCMETYKLNAEPEQYVRKLTEIILLVLAEELQLARDWNYKELYLSMLEATARILSLIHI